MNKPSGNAEVVYQTEAQWTASEQVYGADVIAITTDGANAGKHKLFKGTGKWSTLSYVEDGGGGGAVDSVNTQTGVVVLDATDLDIIDFLLVYGAGTPGANGVYPYVGESNSKPSYQKGTGNGSHLVTWGAVADQWTIGLVGLSPTYYYNSTDDVATPDLATFTVTAGAGPVPTVELFTGTIQQALQALAALQGESTIAGVYEAALTQVGTAAPTAVVFQNTTGRTVTWTRDGAGVYTGTFSVACVVANSGASIGSGTSADPVIAPSTTQLYLTAGNVELKTLTLAADGATDVTMTATDDILLSTLIRLILR